MDARSDGMDGWMDGVDPGYRDGRGEARRDDVPHRTVRFIYVRFDYVDGTAGDWVRTYVRTYVHTPFEGTDGNRARWLSEAGQTNRNARTNERTYARDVGNTEDGGRVKRKE